MSMSRALCLITIAAILTACGGHPTAATGPIAEEDASPVPTERQATEPVQEVAALPSTVPEMCRPRVILPLTRSPSEEDGSPPPAEPTSSEIPEEVLASETHIIIDGNPSDWAGREAVYRDPAGDAEAGFLDLTTGYAFVNQNALYLLVETVDPDAPFVQFDMDFLTGSRHLQISWKPGDQSGWVNDVTGSFQPVGPASNSAFEFGPALEARVDLADMGSPERLSLSAINVMVGECCDYPAWRVADTFAPGATPIVDEVDPPRLVSDDPRYVLARRFHLPEDYVAELLFTPPAPGLIDIVRSQNGTIFLQQAGLAAGVSTLNPDTGETVRILDLPENINGFLVGGPEDTAFISIGSEVWQVHSDGSYEVWGQAPDSLPRYYAPDGRLLGYSRDGTMVVELLSDGTSHEIASDFTDVYDIVADADGTLFVSEWSGNITRIDPDGNSRVLVEDVLTRDPLDLAFDEDGKLYLSSVATQFVQIDQDTGALTRYPWSDIPCTGHQADFDFAEAGRAFFIDPGLSTITWTDLNTQQFGLLVSNEGANSSAAEIGSDDALYVGTWGCTSEAPAQVVRLSDSGKREVVVDGMCGEVSDIAFDSSGGMYVSTVDYSIGSWVFYVPPGSTDVLTITDALDVGSLTVDSLSGHLLATERFGSTVFELTLGGIVAEHRIQPPLPAHSLLVESASDGTLYAYADEEARYYPGPVVERWLLRLNLEDSSSETVFQFDRQGCCVMANLSADPQGVLWWLVDPDFFLFRVMDDGQATLFAQNLPIDPGAVAVDGQGDVYITSPNGIFRIYREP